MTAGGAVDSLHMEIADKTRVDSLHMALAIGLPITVGRVRQQHARATTPITKKQLKFADARGWWRKQLQTSSLKDRPFALPKPCSLMQANPKRSGSGACAASASTAPSGDGPDRGTGGGGSGDGGPDQAHGPRHAHQSPGGDRWATGGEWSRCNKKVTQIR